MLKCCHSNNQKLTIWDGLNLDNFAKMGRLNLLYFLQFTLQVKREQKYPANKCFGYFLVQSN